MKGRGPSTAVPQNVNYFSPEAAAVYSVYSISTCNQSLYPVFHHLRVPGKQIKIMALFSTRYTKQRFLDMSL
jgi:hypothetical protein